MFLKTTHAARAEAAAARREEKRRQEKERILQVKFLKKRTFYGFGKNISCLQKNQIEFCVSLTQVLKVITVLVE